MPPKVRPRKMDKGAVWPEDLAWMELKEDLGPMMLPKLETPISDVRTSVGYFLKATVSGAEKVFRPELPEPERPNMPFGCIIVYAAGGGHLMQGSRIGAWDSVLDIACYGSTRLEAEAIGDEALYALRELGHETWAGCLLHWARITGGVKSAIDPQTLWPFALITAQVLHSIPT